MSLSVAFKIMLTFFILIVRSGFSFKLRINLSPFTKDYRGGEQLMESYNQFFFALPSGGAIKLKNVLEHK